MAWVAPANLTQRGGSVLTIEKPGGAFDAIVFGEIAPAKWMAGSNVQPHQQAQGQFPVETARGKTLVQVAIVYKGRQITLYRNGTQTATYTADNQERFGGDSLVLIGLRHTEAAPENRFFTGSIEDARIYDVALNAAAGCRAASRISRPIPRRWPGGISRTARASRPDEDVPHTTLFGEARIADGRLHLDKTGAYLLATKESPRQADRRGCAATSTASARALREKLLSDPYRPGYHFVTPEGQAACRSTRTGPSSGRAVTTSSTSSRTHAGITGGTSPAPTCSTGGTIRRAWSRACSAATASSTRRAAQPCATTRSARATRWPSPSMMT